MALEEIAAGADIPIPRFLGQSPGGLDSSGDSDMKNYAMKIASTQDQHLTGPARMADMVIARDAGLDMPPRFRWRSLVDISDQEQADILEKTTNAVDKMVAGYYATEDDAQAIITERTGVQFSDPVPEKPEPMLDLPEDGPPSPDDDGDGDAPPSGS